MMEPLTINTSTVSIFDGLQEAYRLVDNVKTDTEKAALRQRLDYVAMTKDSIDQCLTSEDRQSSPSWVKCLDPGQTRSSPLLSLVQTMDDMVAVLRGRSYNTNDSKTLVSPVEKRSLEKILGTIDSYCGQIMLILGSANLRVSRETNLITKSIAAGLQRDREVRRLEQEKTEQKSIEQWLSPLDFPAQQQEIFERAAPIGNWLIESPVFKEWQKGRIAVLRCYGEAGTGKTVLSSIVMEHLSKTSPSSVPVLCAFLEKMPSIPQTPKNILGSLLKQLVQVRNVVAPEIKAAYAQALRKNASVTRKDLERLFKAEVMLYDRVLVVVDGLDESSSETRSFIERNILDMSPDKLGMMTMARPDEEPFQGNVVCNECDLECIFYHHCEDCPQEADADGYDLCENCARTTPLVCPRDSAHELQFVESNVAECNIDTPGSDIATYIRSIMVEQMPMKVSRLDMSSRKRLTTPFGRYCSERPERFAEIIDAIVLNVEGRFQLAKQFIRSLETESTIKAINLAIDQIQEDGYRPDMLDKLYEKDMNDRIKDQKDKDVATAMRILSVVAGAYRKLSLRELQHALATNMGTSCYDSDDEIDRHDILTYTKGLIRIDRDGAETVRLEHQTWYEYFARTGDQWFPQAHADLGNICLTYLNFDVFSEAVDIDDLETSLSAKHESHPLITYAVQHWGNHVSKAGSEVDSLALGYLRDRKRLAAYIQLAWAIDTPEHEKWDIRKQVHPLHVCAWFDLWRLMDEFQGRDRDVDVKEGTYSQTPLLYACRRGNVEAARTLLQLGASINFMSDKGRSPMMEAILRLGELNQNAQDHRKSLDVVKLLTRLGSEGYGLDINVSSSKMHDRTALMIAILRKQEDLALAILTDVSNDLNHQDSEGWTPLALSAYLGMGDVIEVILEHTDVLVDAIDHDGRSALWKAAEQDHSDVVRMLLSHGADPTFKDIRGRTPAMRAAEMGNIDVLQVMQDFPFDVSCKDEEARNLLHAAAEVGDVVILQLLLDKGLQHDMVDDHGMTPLHTACRFGQAEIVQLLLKIGASVSQEDRFGRTPHSIAWQYGHNIIVELCKCPIQVGSTEAIVLIPENLPLWSIIKLRRHDLITAYIADTTRDPPSPEPCTGSTVIHCAIWETSTHPETDILILKQVLDVWSTLLDEPDKHKQTPLHLAACYGDTEATKALLEYDPELNSLDRFGHTPLAVAHSREHYNVSILLIEAGADVSLSKVNLQSMMFAAAEMQNIQAVKNLVAAGADRMSQDEFGRTLDQVARQSGGKDMLIYLQGVRSFARTETVKVDVDVTEEEVDVEYDYEGAKHVAFRPFRAIDAGYD